MHVRNWLLAAAAIAVLAPAAAQAQDSGMMSDTMAKKGFYVGAGATANLLQDADLSGTGISTDLETDLGWGGMAEVGYHYGNGFRVGLEVNYRRASVDSVSGTSDGSGSVSGWGGLINGYYDFNTGTKFTPYLGAGIGVARIKYDDVSPVGGSFVNDSSTQFAYQGIAGASYALTDNLDLTADYRYMRTLDPSFNTSSGVGVDSEFAEHRFMIGFRWNFGAPQKKMMPEPKPVAAPAPAPAPPPAPAPAPVVAPAPAPQVPQTYLVFFDWDSTALRPDALEIIRQAAQNANQTNVAKIRTIGHADRSGTVAYNMGLSQRRAEAVQKELARQGYAAGDMDVSWKGESDPLVPTADGVREPQNRRVEIDFE